MNLRLVFILGILTPLHSCKPPNKDNQGLKSDSSGASHTEEPAQTVNCSLAGPQAPRDVEIRTGTNPVQFMKSPAYEKMHLCNIHFHRFAEHKSKGFSQLVGEGDHAGFTCKQPVDLETRRALPQEVCVGQEEHPQLTLAVDDTIEVHWVYTTCLVDPGPSLNSCFSEFCKNPQLRVEARVFTLLERGGDEISKMQKAPRPVGGNGALKFLGSTTGPSYSQGCSPFQVTWNVDRSCHVMNISDLASWCRGNAFLEDHAHGVRKLVEDPAMLNNF